MIALSIPTTAGIGKVLEIEIIQVNPWSNLERNGSNKMGCRISEKLSLPLGYRSARLT
jgi:hypothetical protein